MGETNAGGTQTTQKRRGRPRKQFGDANDTHNQTPSAGQTASSGGGTTPSNIGTEGIEVVSEMVSRVDEKQIPEPDKPKRGRPRGSTSAPRKTTKAGDREQTKFMVQTLLMTAFNITSLRAGAHWKLTSGEAEALADPIAAIMERHDLTEKTGAYGDYIALVAAMGMIIVPKVMMSLDSKKKEGGIRLVQEPTKSNGAAGAGTPAATERNASPTDASSRPVQRNAANTHTPSTKQSLGWLGG